MPVDGGSEAGGGVAVIDVGDGARPAYSTLVGQSIRDLSIMDFDRCRSRIFDAEIVPWKRRASVFTRVEV